MTIFLMLAAGTWAIAAFAAETPVGRLLWRALVQRPADWLNAAGPMKLFALIAVGLFMAAAPEIGVLFAVDLTLYVEVLTAAILVSSQLRLSVVVERTYELLRKAGPAVVPRRMTFRAARAMRSVRRRLRPPANDPDGWALA